MFGRAVIALSCLVAYAHGHGRLDVPANRASLWRTGRFADAPHNYDDDGLNCGGFDRQYSVNGGRCGICGDAFDNSPPRPHELGGKFGLGHIVATYEQGQVINTRVYISAYHMGYWEFRLCLDPSDQTQECFAHFLLELEDGGTKYYPKGTGYYDVNYRLPADVVCDHCVLQWKYTAGNNWGFCGDGTGALGCGNQENFFSCSDISIKRTESIPVNVPIINLNAYSPSMTNGPVEMCDSKVFVSRIS
uniref:SFRICE_001188 n=1 Tax=Spodoptera frugiperda TaxID=7108 RepID=A0A2H1VW77_SPOFR